MCVRARLGAGCLAAERAIIRTLQRALFPPFLMGQAGDIRHIVIYRIGNIGDIALAVPPLRMIRSADGPEIASA